MAFKSDKQRKAVMAQLNQPNRSDTSPVMMKQTKFQKLKGFISKEKEVLRLRKERKGFERIRKEKIALEREKVTAERLRAELETEQARETVAMQRRETQVEFKKIEKARRTRRLAPFVTAGRRIKAGVQAGIRAERRLERTGRRVSRTRRKKSREKDIAPFGIEF